MTDTLQAEDDQPDDLETIQPESGESVDPSQGADEAPAEPKKLSFDDDQQAFINSKIGDMTRDTNNERREKEAALAELNQLKSQMPQEQRPNVPAMPDQFDENADELLRQRDQAIADQARFDGRQAFAQEQQQLTAQTQQNETKQKLQAAVVEYKGIGQKFGFSESDMQTAGNALNDGGLSQDIQFHILFDKSGPLIADFLSKNPVEMGNLRNMTPLAQAAYIEGTIKPNASKTRKTTNAPEPADILSGSGSPPTKRGPLGATYE